MLGVSEQVSLAELATELAEARAAFMEQHSGNVLYAMTGLECVQKSLAMILIDLQSYATPHSTSAYAHVQLQFPILSA